MLYEEVTVPKEPGEPLSITVDEQLSVVGISAKSPAKGLLHIGDVILEIDDCSVQRPSDVFKRYNASGENVRFFIQRTLESVKPVGSSQMENGSKEGMFVYIGSVGKMTNNIGWGGRFRNDRDLLAPTPPLIPIQSSSALVSPSVLTETVPLQESGQGPSRPASVSEALLFILLHLIGCLGVNKNSTKKLERLDHRNNTKRFLSVSRMDDGESVSGKQVIQKRSEPFDDLEGVPRNRNNVIIVYNWFLDEIRAKSARFAIDSVILSGFVNADSSCYAISVLQLLFAIPALKTLWSQSLFGGPVHAALCAAHFLWNSKKFRAIDVRPLFDCLSGVIGKPIICGLHEDLITFFILLLDTWQGDLDSNAQLGDLFMANFCSFGSCRSCHFPWNICYEDLTINVNPNAGDVVDALRRRFGSEDMKKKCEQCGEMTGIRVQHKVRRLSDVMLIHIGLGEPFTSGNIDLDMGPFIERNTTALWSYTLNLVINYEGSGELGHYYGFKKTNDKWIKFNDANISECEEPDWSTATLLVYFKNTNTTSSLS